MEGSPKICLLHLCIEADPLKSYVSIVLRPICGIAARGVIHIPFRCRTFYSGKMATCTTQSCSASSFQMNYFSFKVKVWALQLIALYIYLLFMPLVMDMVAL